MIDWFVTKEVNERLHLRLIELVNLHLFCVSFRIRWFASKARFASLSTNAMMLLMEGVEARQVKVLIGIQDNSLVYVLSY